MNHEPILKYVKQLKRRIFTTRELYAISGKSLSSTVQCLNRLSKQGALIKIRRGVWAEQLTDPISLFHAIPYLAPNQRIYLSFTSALHLHGIIEQIPQIITCASLSHTQTIKTSLGSYAIHKISSDFFFGFDWYKQTGDFLVAEPEKALLDCLYLSGRKGRQFSYFPELDFPKSFSFDKAKEWARRIKSTWLQKHVLNRLDKFQKVSVK